MDKNSIRSVLLPTAWVIPWWLHMLPPFDQLAYVKRTYQNDYTSNTRIVVVLRKRSPETRLSDRECRDAVYAGAALQTTCLCLKSLFCKSFWIEFVREVKSEFRMK